MDEVMSLKVTAHLKKCKNEPWTVTEINVVILGFIPSDVLYLLNLEVGFFLL